MHTKSTMGTRRGGNDNTGGDISMGGSSYMGVSMGGNSNIGVSMRSDVSGVNTTTTTTLLRGRRVDEISSTNRSMMPFIDPTHGVNRLMNEDDPYVPINDEHLLISQNKASTIGKPIPQKVPPYSTPTRPTPPHFSMLYYSNLYSIPTSLIPPD